MVGSRHVLRHHSSRKIDVGYALQSVFLHYDSNDGELSARCRAQPPFRPVQQSKSLLCACRRACYGRLAGTEFVYARFLSRRLLPPLYRMCGSVFGWQCAAAHHVGRALVDVGDGSGRSLPLCFVCVRLRSLLCRYRLTPRRCKFYDLSVPHCIHGYPEVVAAGTEKKPFPS